MRAAAAILTRLTGLAAGVLLVGATISLAADTSSHPVSMKVQPKLRVLVVPDVRRQVFVFAKGMLEDSGFGWQVKGTVHGFASNRVVSQSPAPGLRVVDTGAPKITLELSRSGSESGTPEDVSPYGASLIRPAAIAQAKAVAAKQAKAPANTAHRRKVRAKSA